MSQMVLVDLDHNSIRIPDTVTRSKLPEPEFTKLFTFLRKLLHNDLYSLDEFYISPKRTKPSETVSVGNSWNIAALRNGSFDQSIRSAFLLFFVSIFRDYRQYFSYIRVLPEPMAVFNKRLFLNSRQESQVRAVRV